jgi:hypothetical protein
MTFIHKTLSVTDFVIFLLTSGIASPLIRFQEHFGLGVEICCGSTHQLPDERWKLEQILD